MDTQGKDRNETARDTEQVEHHRTEAKEKWHVRYSGALVMSTIVLAMACVFLGSRLYIENGVKTAAQATATDLTKQLETVTKDRDDAVGKLKQAEPLIAKIKEQQAELLKEHMEIGSEIGTLKNRQVEVDTQLAGLEGRVEGLSESVKRSDTAVNEAIADTKKVQAEVGEVKKQTYANKDWIDKAVINKK